MIKPWNPDEQREYDDLLREVCEQADSTGRRVALMDRKIADAVQAHRQWASDVQREAMLIGYGEEIKRFLKRARQVVAIGERKVRKPSVIGTKRPNVDGELVDYQLPFAVLTFDELRKKRHEYLRSMSAYTDNVALIDRLVALEDMSPGAASPHDAAVQLGIDLGEYLAA